MKKYLANTGWLFFEKVIRVLVTLTVWAMVIRYLGPRQFGVFSYALSYVFLFGMLADCGMEAVLVKDLVERPTQGPVIMGSAFVLRFLGAITEHVQNLVMVYTVLVTVINVALNFCTPRPVLCFLCRCRRLIRFV